MAISPSRVNNSTVPISRMYMRTGSVVRPPSASSDDSAAAASSAAVSSSLPREASDSNNVSASGATRSEEHTSELQSLMSISYDVFCLIKHTTNTHQHKQHNT